MTEVAYEFVDTRFKRCVLGNALLETLGEGFRWLEGPVWFADHQALYVSDLPDDRVMRWTPSAGMSVFRQPSGFENGHARDLQGRLISCSHHGRLTRTELDGTVTVLAERFEGRRLNSPNDVVVKSDGSIWFSDPHYGLNTDYEGGKREAELPPTLYRLDPASGALDIMVDDFKGPNGIAFSPDESKLYVAETGDQFADKPEQHIRVFDVVEGGARIRGGKRFHKVQPGYADGFKVDTDGNLWSSAADGVHCIDPAGDLLGKILLPSLVSNLCFGGRNRAQLFICASHTLYALYVNRRGAVRP